MVILMFIRIFIFLLMSTSVMAQLSSDLRNALIQRREHVKTWALLCGPGPYEGQYSIYDNMCWQGDMVCYAGLSCLAAELAEDYETSDARANDVFASQESSGRWVRGPMFVGQDYGAGQAENPADFSRDQTRGVFATLVAKGYISQDSAWNQRAQCAAAAWLSYINRSGNKICPEDSRTCKLTTGTYNMFYNVYRHIGVPTKEYSLHRDFYASKWYYRWGFLAETRTLCLDEYLRDKWYPRHLKANTALLYRVMNMDIPGFAKRNKHIARVLGKAVRRIYRGDPKNPLYRLLYEGVTSNLAEWVLDKYPFDKPMPTDRPHDWSLQRHTSERAWERCDGHDQIYLINLILAKDSGRIVW